MRKSHLYLFGVAIVTAFFLAVSPGAAAVPGQTLAIAMQAEERAISPDQMAQFDSWPAEKQRQYDLWPPATKEYYWSLDPVRQGLFWRLADEDKIALTAMTGPEREATWRQIMSRVLAPPSDGSA